jgi:hypothetical protein
LPAQPGRNRSRTKNRGSEVAKGALAGAGAGVLIGGTWGWIAGIGALTIPGVGLFLAAGPVICAIGGAVSCAAVAGVCGGLIGLGAPPIEDARYEEKSLRSETLIGKRGPMVA